MCSLRSPSKLRSIYLYIISLITVLQYYGSLSLFGSLSKIQHLKSCRVWNTSWYTIAFVALNKNVIGVYQVSIPAFVSFPCPLLRILDNLTDRRKVFERLPLDLYYCSGSPFNRGYILNIHLHTSCFSHTYLYLICIVMTTGQLQLIPYIPQIGKIKQITFIISLIVYIPVICGPKPYNCGHCTRTGHRQFLPAKLM